VYLLLGLGLVAVLVVWLSRPAPPAVQPGDAIEPVDEAALAEAEQDLKGGTGATLEEAEDDDWGPGAGR